MLTAVIFDIDTTLLDDGQLRDGAGPVLDYCGENNLVIAGLTDMAEDEARQRLRDAGVGDVFGPVVSTTDLDLDRADPALLTVFCQRTGLRAEQCMLVGDRRDTDGQARKIGVTTVILTTTDSTETREPFTPDHTIEELDALREIIGDRL